LSYIILRDHWCDIIVLNVHTPTEDTDDVKDSFYKELESVFDKFPKYYMKILLGDFNAKVGREDIFKPTIRNECLHKIRLVNFATPRNHRVKSTMFPHRKSINILGHLQMGKKTHNRIDNILVDRRRH
jgi:hypothetical protein